MFDVKSRGRSFENDEASDFLAMNRVSGSKGAELTRVSWYS